MTHAMTPPDYGFNLSFETELPAAANAIVNRNALGVPAFITDVLPGCDTLRLGAISLGQSVETFTTARVTEQFVTVDATLSDTLTPRSGIIFLCNGARTDGPASDSAHEHDAAQDFPSHVFLPDCCRFGRKYRNVLKIATFRAWARRAPCVVRP